MTLRICSTTTQVCKGVHTGPAPQSGGPLWAGWFWFVTKGHNIETSEAVAIKVNRNHLEIAHQVTEEIATLKWLWRLDPDTCNIVRRNGFFLDRYLPQFGALGKSLCAYVE